MSGSLAVIDPGTRVPELDCHNRIALASPVPVTYHLPALFWLDTLSRAEPSAIVILGSGASVNDTHAWQTALVDWLRPRVQRGVPTLGLCYGHQLLAWMFGGQVGFLREDHSKRLGLRDVTLDATDAWAAGTGRLLVTHREAVRAVPDTLRVVGRSDELPVEAIAHRDLPVFGLQAHPEATCAFARNNAVPFDGTDADLAFGHAIVDGFVRRYGA